MKRLTLLGLIFFCFPSPFIFAQPEVDSLQKVIRSAPADTHQVNRMNRVGFLLKVTEPDSAMACLNRSIALASDLGFKEGEGRAWMYRGQSLTATGDYTQAIEELETAVRLFREAKAVNAEGKAWNSIGIVHYYQNDLDQAIAAYSEALEHFTDTFYIATTHHNLAQVLKFNKDEEGFVREQLKAMEKFKAVGKENMVVYCYGNLSVFYMEREDLEKAWEYNQLGFENMQDGGRPDQRVFLGMPKGEILLSRGETEAALEVFQEVKALATGGGLRREEATALLNLGEIYRAKGQVEMAKGRLMQSDALFRDLGDLRGQALCQASLGLIRVQTAAPDSGLLQLQRSLDMAIEFDEPVTLAKVFDRLSSAYEFLGDTEQALHFRKKHGEVLGELRSPAKWRKVIEAENKIKEEISLKQNPEESLEGNRIPWWAILLGSLLLVGLGVYFFRRKMPFSKAQDEDRQMIQAETRGRIRELRELLQEKERKIRELQQDAPESTVAPQLPRHFDTLTNREIEVFLCLGAGLSDKEIADELSISLSTVRTHTRNVYSKLELHNRSAAIKMAHEYRLLRNQE